MGNHRRVNVIETWYYMVAMVGTDPSLWRNEVGFFCPRTPMANSVGLEALRGPRDLDAVRKALTLAGYNGEKVVVLTPTDITAARALAEITADVLHKLGMTVEAPTMDWATMVQRRTSTEPVEQGGWSIFHTGWAGLDMINPAGHIFLRGNGRAAAPGWPDSQEIETLREAWFAAPDINTQQAICRRLQLRAFIDVPYIPLGQCLVQTAYQSNLTGMVKGSPVFWNIRRT
jgi:peptide/nickel transport system substrate-binding protein